MSTGSQAPSGVIPFLVAALTCDTVSTDPSTGKKSLIGVFSHVISTQFPLTRHLSLYYKVTDAEGYYPIEIEFANADDNNVLGTATAAISISDRNGHWESVVDFPSLPVPKPGRYEFRIKMAGFFLGNATLDAITPR